jgi:hypothetical protein
MIGYAVVLDPAAVAPGRAELSLNSGNIAVVGGEGHGIDWGEAAIKAFLAEQQFGEVPTDFRVPNRIVSIPLLLGAKDGGSQAEQEAARRTLAQKVALFQRQGGVLMRKRATGEPLYADIINATLTVPDVWEGEVEPGVLLKLECLPDFYGEEIELDAVEETGQIAAVLKKAGVAATIAGDYPARTRVVLTEKASKNQRGVLWGFRSTYYDALATSALSFDTYTMTTINGAVTGIASGGEQPAFSGKVAKLVAPEPNTWHPFIELTSSTIATGASGSEPKTKHLQHQGSYRVWARVTGTAGQRFRLAWSANDATAPILNASMALDETGPWQLLDLGEIRIEEPPFGDHWWNGLIQVETGPGAHEVLADRLWLQPLDDGAGKLRATAVPTSTLLSPVVNPAEAESSNTIHAGTAWPKPKDALAPTYLTQSFVSLAASASSQALAVEKAGFSIPAGATIKGIEIAFSAGQVAGTAFGFMQLTGGLLKAGAVSGTTKSLIAGAGEPLVWGGPSDLWGTTWTPAQINAATFGSYAYFTNTGAQAHEGKYSLQTIRVYYSFSASAVAEDAVIYSGRTAQVTSEGSYRTATTSYACVSEETGDLPRLPPSGIENRPCQLFVKNSRGLLPEPGALTAGEADSGIDKIQAQIFYRPCYIGRI